MNDDEGIRLPRRKKLLLPMSPFDERMLAMGQMGGLPSVAHPHYARTLATVTKLAESDRAFQRLFREKIERLPAYMHVRMNGGAGLLMAEELRWYFQEYANRLLHRDRYSLPSSFNVVESFLRFDSDMLIYDLRPEKDHLLTLNDFFDWYTSFDVAIDPTILMDSLPEGVVYSYSMTNDSEAYTLSGADSTIVIGGCSLVRHRDEVSCILTAGECPPRPPVDINQPGWTPPDKRGLHPDPDLDQDDRFLSGYDGHGKIVLLSRFSPTKKWHDVRYINIDTGPAFVVLTDDWDLINPPGQQCTQVQKESMLNELAKYGELFSAMAALMFLPVAFADWTASTSEVHFGTRLRAQKKSDETKRAIKLLGKESVLLNRSVKILARRDVAAGTGRQVSPPAFEFESSGYWQTLPPGQVGQDRDGTPIIGQTWVERTEQWTTLTPHDFVLRTPVEVTGGPNPGYVYVMRSLAHKLEVYKVGLTERTPEARAQDLTRSTASPLPFEVLANWYVPDCKAVEARAHELLAEYRFNKRREFFLCPIDWIVHSVEQAISDLAGTDQS